MLQNSLMCLLVHCLLNHHTRDGHYNDEEVDDDYVGDCVHGDGEDGDNGVSNGDGDSDCGNPSEAPEQMRIWCIVVHFDGMCCFSKSFLGENNANGDDVDNDDGRDVKLVTKMAILAENPNEASEQMRI